MAKTIRIQNITLAPFKGVRTSLDLNGNNAEVRGENGTGKTTIADAWLWLLTGKSFAGLTDSGKGAFSVLPINANSAEVKADITIDGEAIRLTRRIETSGKSKSKKTVFLLDETEVNKTQYDDFIREKFGVSDLRPFTVPGDFLAHDTKWQREVLLATVKKMGEATDTAIEPDEQPVLDEINKIGDFSTWEKGKKNSIKDTKAAIAAIPGRIKTAESLRPEPADYDAIEKELNELSAQKPTKEMPKEWKETLAEKERIFKDYADRRSKALAKITLANSQHQDLVAQQRAATDNDNIHRQQLVQKKQRLLAEMQTTVGKRDELRNAWHIQDEQQRTPGNPSCISCPLYPEIQCDNAMILANAEESEKAAAAAFEDMKRKKLDEFTAEGKKCNENIKRIEEEIKAIDNELAQPFTLPLVDEIAQAAALVEQYTAEVPAAPDTKELDEKLAQYQLTANNADAAEAIRTDKIRHLAAKLGERDQIAKIDAQIAAIEKEQESLQIALGDFENRLSIGQGIKRRQMQSLENAVNSHFFSNIRFALFEEQVNGEYGDTCQLLIDGIPYSRGANRAAEINAALSICDFLQQSVDVSLPIFLDNAESVNNIAKVTPQTIRLRVTDDEELNYVTLD